MSYNQTNTEYTTGTGAGTGTTGTGTGTGLMDKVKNAVHSTGDGAGNTRQNVGGLGNEGVAPGAGGMTTEVTGHHGHHHHGHHGPGAGAGAGSVVGQIKQHIPGTTEHQMKQDVQGAGGMGGAGYDAGYQGAGAGTGGSTMSQVKQHIPGTTEHQMKQGVQGAGGMGASGADYSTGTGGMHASHHTDAGAGNDESMKEKILKHIPGTEERAQYKATGTAAGSAGGAGTAGTTGADRAL